MHESGVDSAPMVQRKSPAEGENLPVKREQTLPAEVVRREVVEPEIEEDEGEPDTDALADVAPATDEELDAIEATLVPRLPRAAPEGTRALALRDPMAAYMAEVRRYPLLTREEEHELAVRWVEHGDQEAAKKLVTSNLRLVVKIANEYRRGYQNLLDLVQEGNLGLMRAAEKFDPSRGFRFSTYAIWWIRQAVTRSLADHGRTIRLPVHVVESLHKLARLRREHVGTHGREPTPEELAERLDIPVTRVRFLLTLGVEPTSLESPIGEDGELRDLIEDESAADPVAALHELQLTGKLQRALASLTDREERVLRLRFGMDGEDEQTLEVVGREFALTRERVRQIEAKALQKLRRPSAALIG